MSYLQIIEPVSSKATYSPQESITFHIALPMNNQSVESGSICIMGYVTLVGLGATDTISNDPLVGVASLFDNIICSDEKHGSLPSLNNYQMIQKVKNVCNNSTDVFGINKDNEWRFGNGDFRLFYNKMDGKLGFMHKIDCQYNNVVEGTLNRETCGSYLQIQFNLTSAQEAFACTNATLSYTISELKCVYNLAPPMNEKKSNLVMISYSLDTPDLNSNSLSRSKEVSAMSIMSSSLVFQKTANYKKSYLLNTRLDDIDISKLQYTYNDISDVYHEYSLESKEEILQNGIMSMNVNGNDTFGLTAVEYLSNDNRVAGMLFPALIQPNKQKISYYFEANNSSNTNTYKSFVLWRGLLSFN